MCGAGVNVDVGSGDEVVEKVDEEYQGSDIDTTLETAQAMGELAVDTYDSILSGKPKGKTKEFKEGMQSAGGAVLDAYQDLGSDMIDTYQDIMFLPAQQMNTITSIAQNLSKNLQTNLKRQGMMAGTSGFDQSMEDPTLAGRRRRGRRRGNEKDVRSGALKIPSSSVGVQIPA